MSIEITPRPKEQTEGYFSRNASWLKPLLATLLLLVAATTVEKLRQAGSDLSSLPALSQGVVAAIIFAGLATSAAFSVHTDTISARLFRWGSVAVILIGFSVAACTLIFDLISR
ncbi:MULTISPECIES: hypothetical protein [Pseudomonas]|uniref:Uncharacterized protein n=1 Tax=Pseudomonas fluorescens TaxID=294 RepID=A0A162B2J4_PSEFL|nr:MULTISPECIES: hypothetical protein [Pseudomonas]KZN20706.1 hypothetical protein A1D17_03965 [Pseudomonas fluorescens]